MLQGQSPSFSSEINIANSNNVKKRDDTNRTEGGIKPERDVAVVIT
jgi:hypothetical protein